MVTLDNIHHKKVSELKDITSDTYNRRLEELNESREELMKDTSSKNSIALMKLNEEIEQTKNNIANSENNGFIKDYYLEAGDILFKYYDGIENVETTKIDVTPSDGGILSYLGMNNDDKDETDSVETEETEDDDSCFFGQPVSREELRHEYLSKVNIPNTASTKKVKKGLSKTTIVACVCENCKSELSHIPSEGVVECKKCGMLQSIVNDTDRSSYKDPPKESCYYSYRRSNHFNEWIAQFQGKETTQIPRQVLVQVISEIKKERIRNLNELTSTKIRSILKKLKLNKYYEHIPHIINQLNGQPPPYMSRQTEEVLRIMFQKIQGPFLEFCPKKRKNFLSYSYVLHKFVELLDMHHLKPLFPLLKSREKLFQQDCIWKKICGKVGWEFHKSI